MGSFVGIELMGFDVICINVINEITFSFCCLFIVCMRNGMDVRFKVPSNFYISGQSQCGKSYLVRRLLYYLNELFHTRTLKGDLLLWRISEGI